MWKRLLWLLLCGVMSAQVQTTITGTITDASGTLATSGYVEFDLSPNLSSGNYSVPGIVSIVPQIGTCGINGSGQLKNVTLSGPCLIWGNGNIVPANSLYTVVFAPNGDISNSISNINIPLSGVQDLSQLNQMQPQQVTFPIVNANPLTTMSLSPSIDGVFNIGDSKHRYAGLFLNNFPPSNITPGLLGQCLITNVVAIWGGCNGQITVQLLADNSTSVAATPTNTTSPELMHLLAVSAGQWNTLGKMFHTKSRVTINAANVVETIVYGWTVSVGSGTSVNYISINNTVTTTYVLTVDSWCQTTGTGVSGSIACYGNWVLDNGSVVTSGRVPTSNSTQILNLTIGFNYQENVIFSVGSASNTASSTSHPIWQDN